MHEGVIREGIVFNIQRFTVHDGPGIRTEIFFKGCPLECAWCSNPESQELKPEVGVYSSKCIGIDKCGMCIDGCSRCADDYNCCSDDYNCRSDDYNCRSDDCNNEEEQETLKYPIKVKNRIVDYIDRNNCNQCMKCAGNCPAEALKPWGEKLTVKELLDIIMKDEKFYKESQGGVTFSGGEPLVQKEFLEELLIQCKNNSIHTCVETTFYSDWKTIEKIMPYVDLFITDIKTMDSQKHEYYTGVDNSLILDNIERVVSCGKKLIIRIPIIPNINDDRDNLEKTADYILNKLNNNIELLQLLRFRPLGVEKYKSLGKPYKMKDVTIERTVFEDRIREMEAYFQKKGIDCIAGTTSSNLNEKDSMYSKE